jgi:hypothetical protein
MRSYGYPPVVLQTNKASVETIRTAMQLAIKNYNKHHREPAMRKESI